MAKSNSLPSRQAPFQVSWAQSCARAVPGVRQSRARCAPGVCARLLPRHEVTAAHTALRASLLPSAIGRDACALSVDVGPPRSL